jgi:homoserine kinase
MSNAIARVRVPGSSANLGPGFDALALALELFVEVFALPRPSGAPRMRFSSQHSGEHTAGLPEDDSNLIWRAFLRAFRQAGQAPPDLQLHVHNEIPLGRGLGSSGAAAVAGIALANAAGRLNLAPLDVLMLAVEVEGHPDNVAASALGGLAVVAPPSQAISLPWPARVALVVASPEVQLATSRARSALPDSYSRADAVFNLQRAALLVAAAVSGNTGALRVALQDRWHQPYRTALVPGLEQALALECPGLYGVALSGAGPSLIAFVDRDNPEPARHGLEAIYQRLGIAGTVRGLRVAENGVEVLQPDQD